MIKIDKKDFSPTYYLFRNSFWQSFSTNSTYPQRAKPYSPKIKSTFLYAVNECLKAPYLSQFRCLLHATILSIIAIISFGNFDNEELLV